VTIFHWLSFVYRLEMVHLDLVPGYSVAQEFVTVTFLSPQQWSHMSIHFCFSFSVSIQETHHKHNFQHVRSAVIACAHSHEMAVLFAFSCWEMRWFSLFVSSV
jgi:hypothetical protein